MSEPNPWEAIENVGTGWSTDRLEVPGGWLYRHIMRLGVGARSSHTVSIIFVPRNLGDGAEIDRLRAKISILESDLGRWRDGLVKRGCDNV